MRNSHKYVLLLALFILSLSLFYLPEPSVAQQNAVTPEVANVVSPEIHKRIPASLPETKENDFINEAKFIYYSFIVSGIIVVILTLIVTLAIGLGLFEPLKNKIRGKGAKKDFEEFRKDVLSIVDAVKKENTENEATEIIEALKQKYNETEELGKGIPTSPIIEKPSEELKKTYDEIARRIEIFETFGVPLTLEDYLKRGNDLYYKTKYEDARRAYDKAIELKSDYAEAWYNKGIAFDELEKYEEALKTFNKAIELKPDHANAWNNKGVALVNLKKYEYALKTLDTAIELKPDYASAWFNRACAYSLKRDKENALENLKKAIELDKKYKEDAKTDEDFKNLWDDPDFKKLVC